MHFQNATGHEDELFAAIRHFDAHRTRLDAGDQRCVAGINAQLARFAGQGDKARFTGEDGLFGTDHINVDGVHLCSLKRLKLVLKPTHPKQETPSKGRPRSEGVVPLPKREGEAALAAQGVKVR
ncbi:hypothetical protein SDC9_196566 [bioreactor metagenome]|uniref:Uncharacterized protein n=1 Tax=bioreactor metagenome TaxID=1076179 RepID=A0A645INY0_9ZZZZ